MGFRVPLEDYLGFSVLLGNVVGRLRPSAGNQLSTLTVCAVVGSCMPRHRDASASSNNKSLESASST